MTEQKQTISHTGDVFGASNVSLAQNRAGSESGIAEFTAPDSFQSVELDGDKHDLRFVPRTQVEITGTTGDDTVVHLVDANGNEVDIQPIAGEKTIAEQDYPVAVAFNRTTGTQYSITDVNYATNEITLSNDPASGDTVAIWPVVTQGSLKIVGRNALGQSEGPVSPFGIPIYRFHDLAQLRSNATVGVDGRVEFGNPESIEFVVHSPHEIVWTDADYPEGEFVSTLAQEVTVEV